MNTRELVKHIFVWTILFFTFLPLYLMINISLKDNVQFARNPWFPEPPFRWENYAHAWSYVSGSIFNTVFVSITSVVIMLTVALLGAFFFARYKIIGSKFLFFVFLLLMMYPGVANLVPVFKLISSLGLYNSHWAVILVAISAGQAMAIFILRNFIEDIPNSLFDAAEVDGCSILGQIKNIVIPMCMPILGTLAILNIITVWNSFVSPMVFLRDSNKQMISVALLHLEGEYIKQWGQLMAGYTIASLPLIVLFIFCMRLFVKGLGEGAIKG